MFSSLLVANRGEIAVRIMRTAKRMGLRAIAVHSDADASAMHVRLADEAHRIGPAPARDSYLSIEKVIAAAKASGAEAIHPGYGFLSERAEFAEACAAAGIVFVGPPPAAIRAMGLKDGAKTLMRRAGVPVVPGYEGEDQDPARLARAAEAIGYPILIKAVAGGGGKGMKRVERPEDFADALASARREAENAFGDPRVLVEKYVLSPRHIEIQVFGDSHGNVVHLFERDCSLQRRHQKVIEEAPAPGMPQAMREAMGRAAVEAAKAVGYVGAGTVEFIADGSAGLQPDRFYFMEMNTRLQVEHPVTEAITGQDLVEWQLRVATGEKLPLTQDQLTITGHAVEARLYAEDPERGFLPSTGRLAHLRFGAGEGVRIDTGVETGAEVTPYYDPMIAKVIASGATRDEALDRLSAALGKTIVAGPRANTAFLRALADAPGFRAGAFDTGFIERNLEALGATPRPAERAAVRAAALALIMTPEKPARDPWAVADGFQLGGSRATRLALSVDGERAEVRLLPGPSVRDAAGETRAGEPTGVILTPVADGILAVVNGRQAHIALYDPFAVDLDHLDGSGLVKAPMHGKVVAMFVEPGQTVAKGDRVAVLEAMKMEHTLLAPVAGKIASVAASAGQQVNEGVALVVVEVAA